LRCMTLAVALPAEASTAQPKLMTLLDSTESG
jgi:hypothetical protein